MLVARLENLADSAEGDAYLGLHAMLVLLQDRRVVAPGQELGIPGDIDDQGEHFLGAVPDENGFVDGFHRECGAREAL